MTWEILMGLLTLLSALAGLAKTITNNTRALTEIRCTVSALNDTVLQQRKDLGVIREELQRLVMRVHDLERDMEEGGRYD
ncbi:MAG: SlyX family protein [Ruminococcaceae bacterium]|nr:SlyX family protein [Oscillospiraceae bacterium]